MQRKFDEDRRNGARADDRFEDRDERNYRGHGGENPDSERDDGWRTARPEHEASGRRPSRDEPRRAERLHEEDLGAFEQQRWSPGRTSSAMSREGRGYNPVGESRGGHSPQSYIGRTEPYGVGTRDVYGVESEPYGQGRYGQRQYAEDRLGESHHTTAAFGHPREYDAGFMRGEDEGSWRPSYAPRGEPLERAARERHGEPHGMAERVHQFGAELAGRVRRVFRAPKGYRRADERIREDVCDALGRFDELDPSDIEVTVAQGEVTLVGSVPERTMKFLAEQLTDQVRGVTEIHNQLRVPRAGAPSDVRTQEETATAKPAQRDLNPRR